MMTKSVMAAIIVGGLLVALGVAGSRPAAPAAARTAAAFAIDNVRVFDGERTIDARRVLVRNGAIAQVGGELPRGVEVVDGRGGTLMPGLIDAHTHAFGNALDRALIFGVTTELDMFTDHRFASGLRAEQSQPGGAVRRADIFSAGTLITAPGGHGTEYGLAIPTLSAPADAQAFVDARLAEGSDYVKIVYDDGASYGRRIPTIDRATLQAAIGAARNRGKMAVVHIGSRRAAEEAIRDGASGLIHLFADAGMDDDLVARVARAGAFVTPTLSVIESVTGAPGGRVLASHPALGKLTVAAERSALERSFPPRAGSSLRFDHALEATRRLHAARVPILAGTDAPNPGTAHGISMHRELELLVRAGLSAEAALAAATSVPARVFALADRGRIEAGRRADLLLVEGDPTGDIRATREIAAVWKGGVRADRQPAPETVAPEAGTATGTVSEFEDGQVRAAFGAGWQTSTDSRMGGKSEAAMRVTGAGARGSRGALEISGTLAAGTAYPWAGAIFFPADSPMAAVNLSRFTAIAFKARGDGREYQLMVFAERLGPVPAVHAFTPGPDWQEFVVPFSSLSGLDGSDIKAVLFSAGGGPGSFRFAIDDVGFR